MRVLGIDCGTERTGYGVIDSRRRARIAWSPPGSSVPHRSDRFERTVARVIAAGLRAGDSRACSPEPRAVEEVFHAVNAKSALKLAHVRGVALLMVAEAGIACGEYSPLEVKTKRGGLWTRRESAGAVHDAVASGAGRSDGISRDACDALAVAICHATQFRHAVAASMEVAREACRACSRFCGAGARRAAYRSIRNRSPAARRPTSRSSSKPAGKAVYKESAEDELPVKFKMTDRGDRADLRAGRKSSTTSSARWNRV